MDDVRGDLLGPTHGTTPAAVIANKIYNTFCEFLKLAHEVKRVACDERVHIWYFYSVNNITT